MLYSNAQEIHCHCNCTPRPPTSSEKILAKDNHAEHEATKYTKNSIRQ